ncbi:MAG: DUF2075 domain-containing protein [Lactobacillus sp.]|nr:DUF2075 domain-containing protein [Lactobacillus sp.]
MLSEGTFLLDSKAQLTTEQKQLQAQLTQFVTANFQKSTPHLFVIKGDAGTGKSALINELFTNLQQASRHDKTSPFYQTQNYLLINHPEMLKIYQYLAKDNPNLHKKDFQKPTTFINQHHKSAQKADVVFVDEAHLLLTQSDRYNRFEQQNQLAEIIKFSKVVILVVDLKQVLKLKSYWNSQALQNLIDRYPHQIFNLGQQLRVDNPTMIQWINGFTNDHQILPKVAMPNFDFRIFADGEPLYQQLVQRNQQVGLSRMIATADFPYKLDNHDWFVKAGSLRLPWDKISDSDMPWAMRPSTIHEVGSIYTIQGFDLNYAGVILGPSVTYDPKTQRVGVKVAAYQDFEAFKNRHDIGDLARAKAQIIMNSVNVLLKRGRKGLYLYACDPDLRAALLAAQAAETDKIEEKHSKGE